MKELLKNLKFAWKYAKDQKKKLWLLIIINIVQIVISIVAPILSAKVVISLTSNEYMEILLISVLMFMLDTINRIISYFSRIITIKIYRNILSRLEIDLGNNVLKLENACLDEYGSGVFIQRLTGDTSSMAGVFNSILEMSTRLITYIGVLIAIFIVNKIVFLYVFCSLIILYVLEKIRTNKKMSVIKKRENLVKKFRAL